MSASPPPGDAGLYDALLGVLAEHLAAVGLPVSWPSAPFEPQRRDGQLVPYARVSLIPSSSTQYLLQVDFVWPAGTGLRPAVEAADALASELRVGRVVEADGGRRIRVTRDPWQSPPLVGDGELRLPLRVQWSPWR